MNTNRKADLIYALTVKYGSKYRNSHVQCVKEIPLSLLKAQIKFLVDSGYCYQVEGDWFDKCDGIDCAIPFIKGGEFGWRLQSNDHIVQAVKILYEEVYSPEARRIHSLRIERMKVYSTRPRIKRKNSVLHMQRLKRGEISSIPVYR